MIPTRWTTARRALKTSLTGALAALFLTTLPAFAQDTVTLKDGKSETGRVKSADFEGLTIENKGQAKTLEWNTVASIAFKDPPDEYGAGRDAFDAAKFDEALAAFDKLKADKNLRAPIRQDAFYYSASANLAKGNWDAAIAGFDADGNTFQVRTLADGSTVRVMKNFPPEDELRRDLEPFATDVEYTALQYYWLATWRAK